MTKKILIDRLKEVIKFILRFPTNHFLINQTLISSQERLFLDIFRLNKQYGTNNNTLIIQSGPVKTKPGQFLINDIQKKNRSESSICISRGKSYAPISNIVTSIPSVG